MKQDEETGETYIEATATDEDSGDDWIVTLTPDEDGNVVFTKEDMALGSLTIIKKDADGNVLAGVTYDIYLYNNLADTYEKVMSGTTDEEGTVLFDELIYGTYRIIETATLDGLTLLADPIDVTIPYVMTVEEAEALGADMDLAIVSSSGSTCYFVDLTYTVTDNTEFTLPAAGVSPVIPVTLAIGLAVLAFGLFLAFRRKRAIR